MGVDAVLTLMISFGMLIAFIMSDNNHIRKLGLSPSFNGESLSCTYAVRKHLYFLKLQK
ncbi:hypothetical protein [Virgibacillus sp. L01]|uniref:hypothetical protein n=1 Tax=Virgibacillus sp. L01 TaxID=3457429 RepID=UPI003FD26E04